MRTLELKKDPTELESELLSILNEGFELSKPSEYLSKYVEKMSSNSIRVGQDTIDLSNGNLYVLGWGKVSGAMAHALEGILGTEIIKEGIVVTSNPNYQTEKIKILRGTHPLPSKQNIDATKQILSLAEKCTENDYVLNLVSGGGSSILCLPAEGITLEDKIQTTNSLLREGIEVEQINRIRKHLSAIKGGKLAKKIHPASITNLIVSDDIADAIHSIGSGPTVPDPITFKGAQEIIDKYDLRGKLPNSVIQYIDRNVYGRENETLKPDEQMASQITNHIVFNNEDFRDNLRSASESKGYQIFVYPKILSGDFDRALDSYTSFINEVNPNENFIVIAGGEIEVKSQSNGKGGRAQHFAAGMIPRISKYQNAALAAIASDGHDYLANLGGALVTNETQEIIKSMEIPYNTHFKATKSFNIHEALNSHLLTREPTQNNVFDAYIFIHKKK